MTTRTADVGAITTGALTVAAWLAEVEVYLRVAAAIVAICAGIAAGLYHFEAWREKRRNR